MCLFYGAAFSPRHFTILGVNDNMAYSILPLDSASADSCISVIRASFSTVAETFGLTKENCPRNPAFIKGEDVRKRFTSGWLVYGLFADGEMCGHIAITGEGEGQYMLHNLAVLPQHRHKGYGGALLDHAEGVISALGGSKIIIDIIDDNAPLKSWYIAHGFIPLRISHYAGLPFGVCDMEKPLGSQV